MTLESATTVNVASTLQMQAGFKITDSGGNAVVFGDKVDMDNNQMINLGAPTSAGHATTKGYVDQEIANLINGAPGALDTLNELANALGDDADYAATITTALATKATTAYVDSVAGGAGGGASVGVSDDAPVGPTSGDLWFDTTDGSLNVYYNDGSSSQWVGTSGATGATGGGGGGGGGGVTSYADITARDAATPSAGEMAWVISETALYVYDGNEWDRVYSGVQTSPVWTTPPAEQYNLEDNGVATQVTIVATDPEGFDIDYSVSVTPTNQTQATVVHAGNGIFNITPAIKDGVNDGTFTARFSASDGLASSPFYSTFTLGSWNRYELAYTAVSLGSVINVTYQGSGVQNITSVVQGATDGDSILLTPGTYELDPNVVNQFINDPFHDKDISIVGKTNNPHEIVLTINEGGGREKSLFGTFESNARHFANMRIVRPYTGGQNYSASLTSRATGGVVQNCIIDLDGGLVSWAYANSSAVSGSPYSNASSIHQAVWKNCSFVNYGTWAASYSSAADYVPSSNLVLNCAFDETENNTGRERYNYDGSTFSDEGSVGNNITFANTTYDYVGKESFGHMKDMPDPNQIVALTKITKEQWYGV